MIVSPGAASITVSGGDVVFWDAAVGGFISVRPSVAETPDQLTVLTSGFDILAGEEVVKIDGVAAVLDSVVGNTWRITPDYAALGLRTKATITITQTPSLQPQFSNVKLLVGWDGTSPGNRTDESSAAHGAGTILGSSTIVSSNVKYGDGALSSPGGDNGVSWASAPTTDYDWYASDYVTYEAWVYKEGTGGNGTMFSAYLGGIYCWTLSSLSDSSGLGDRVYFEYSGGPTMYSPTYSVPGDQLLFKDEWNHMFAMWDKAANKIYIGVNGTITGVSAGGVPNRPTCDTIYIGKTWVGESDEYRISRENIYGTGTSYVTPGRAFPRS